MSIAGLLLAALIAGACKSSGSGESGLFGPPDQTADAAALVEQANTELKKIRKLYNDNESKREELKKAMAGDDAAAVQKVADDVVYVINDGSGFVDDAIKKLEQAQELNTNDDYKEYLRLKVETLKKQKEAFEEYRQAARSLRDNYDPKNTEQREKVSADFKQRADKYQDLMEKARDYSSQANELAKDVLARQASGQ